MHKCNGTAGMGLGRKEKGVRGGGRKQGRREGKEGRKRKYG